MRAAGGVLVLGSATPPLESYEAALRGKVEWKTLRTRATAQPMPYVHIVDLAKEFETGNKRIFLDGACASVGCAHRPRKRRPCLFSSTGAAAAGSCSAGAAVTCRSARAAIPH